jgi:competence protein ComEC
MWQVAMAFSAGAAALLGMPAVGAHAVAPLAALCVASFVRRRAVPAAACAGFAWTLLLAGGWLAGAWPCARDREPVTVTGRIAAPALEREGRTDFDLDVIAAESAANAPRRIRVAWYESTGFPRPGEVWRLQLRLRCRHGFVNPCAPERDLALLRERIDATAYVAGKSAPVRLTPPAERPVEALRGRIAGGIAQAVAEGPSAAVLQGLAVGVRGAIPDQLWEAFAITGIAHLIAISGLHVTGCAVAVLALLRLCRRAPLAALARVGTGAESAVVVAVTAGYALLSGGSVPALRTLAMVAVFALLRVLRRTWPLHQSLALAGLVLVACDPLALTSAGFWLSFVATAALCAATVRQAGWRSRLVGFAKAQLAVTTLLTPVLAATFGRISLVAPLVNAVAIPVFSLVLLPVILAGTALSAATPGAASALWRLLAEILDRTWPLLEAVAAWPVASFSPAAQPGAVVAATGLALFAAQVLPMTGLRCAAAGMAGALLIGAASHPPAGGYVLTAMDTGQGLATVIETSHHVLVFDTGPRWQSGNAAARVALLPYLRGRGIRRIDVLVVSHDDADHAGGADALRRALPVAFTMTAEHSRLRADATCRRGDSWRWDGVEFRVVHPPSGFEGSDNDRSCAIVVAGRGGSALLLADPEAAGEAEILPHAEAVDVVLVPHHGSRSSSSPALVAAASARVAIVSAGFGNRWDMPDAGVVARWRQQGTSVLVTADEGAIRAEFPLQPGHVAVTTERRENRRWWRPGSPN